MKDIYRDLYFLRALMVCQVLLWAAPLLAQQPPEKLPMVAEKEFRHPDLDLDAIYVSLDQLPATRADSARDRLWRLGASEPPARLDARSDRFVTLWPAEPLVPGSGVGNSLRWSDVGLESPPLARQALEEVAWAAFRAYLEVHQSDLGLDLGELANAYRIAAHGQGAIFQIHVPRAFDGIPVRGSRLSAVINHGNLILLGLHGWADRGDVGPRRQLELDEALRAATTYLAPLAVKREWGKPELVYLTMNARTARDEATYRYPLAWSIKVEVEGDRGSWEVLVDAHTGEILANEDRNHYAEAKGGVYPVTNDGVVPDGVEQAGWPMPFLTVGGEITDTGGNYLNGGSATANLSGPFVRMSDNCGSISLTQSGGLDFGSSGGTDCITPGVGGGGNTHASRTGFYELNKLAEMARGQLPANAWLQQQLTSNMNINATCNAFWNGSSVNFYRSGGGCANTGEIAGVFDHEWGHGMDDNDVEGTVAGPSGEGIADIYTALRLNDSCIGRNFLASPCSGSGDPCLTCTGVRDIDYLQRQSGQPHDFSWSNANCGSSVHCRGAVYSEAVWSLWKRKLQSPPYDYDDNTAHEIVNRLTFIGAGAVSNWFSGSPPNGGCASSSGYQNYLAADDDNGNLNDGTPHMAAIHAAFDDQEIACNTPPVQDSGCADNPASAPTVNAAAGNQSVSLSWNAVASASEYEVFRTEGVFGCAFGKTKIGATAGTTWNDSGLQNGREYSYVVIPKGASDACFGPASACATVTPVAAPDFAIACAPASQSIAQDASASATCTVSSLGGYAGTLSLSCSGNPAGIGCSLAPSSMTLTANGSATSTLTLSVDAAQATGTFVFDVVADDGGTAKSTALTVGVTPAGQNGPQVAAFDVALGAPRCVTAGTECDSAALVDGRAQLGPEPNQPNTLDTCGDGTSGAYQSDESNDRIIVRTLDGFDMSEGATVEVAVTVWAWNTGSADTLDLYYAGDANNPSWVLIGSQVPPGGGAQTLTAQYTLPNGALQAVRANFRYQGAQSPCSGGTYDDTDDLVFAVKTNGPANTPPTVTIAAPANGATFVEGDSIGFSGSAADAEDGDLTADLAWTSSLDGALGAGGSFLASALSVGTHTITTSVSDSGGLAGSSAVTITIDPAGGTPVTVTFTSIAAEDGWVRESSESSNVGGSASATGAGKRPIRPGDASQDRQYKSILSFDTSTIPAGATIQSATLRLRRGTVRGSNPFTSGFGQCLVDVQSGGFSGSTALQASDFEAPATATAVAALSSPAADGDWSQGDLNGAGVAAIDTTGTTQFRVYFQLDDNDDGGDDHMGYTSGDNSDVARHPQLVVTYLP